MKRYAPLDELLDRPRVRVLRALLHFDSATSEDLRIVLDVEDTKRAWNAIATTLSRCVADGEVAREGDRQWLRTYRITDRGRRALRDELARAEIPASFQIGAV